MPDPADDPVERALDRLEGIPVVQLMRVDRSGSSPVIHIGVIAEVTPALRAQIADACALDFTIDRVRPNILYR